MHISKLYLLRMEVNPQKDREKVSDTVIFDSRPPEQITNAL